MMTFSEIYQQVIQFFRMHFPVSLQPAAVVVQPHNRSQRGAAVRYWPLFVFPMLLLMAGCQGPAGPIPGFVPLPAGEAGANDAQGTIPEAVPTTDVVAIVNTGNQRANVRGGPGLDFPIIGKAEPQTTLNVVGQNDVGDWWQVCCLDDDGSPSTEGTRLGWLADSVVSIEGADEGIVVVEPVFPEDLAATWRVDWACGSERCEVKECSATVDAAVGDVTSQQGLRLDHIVTWDDDCFPTDEWSFEVNRFSGQEISSSSEDNFLYGYWLGPQPGERNSTFELADGRQVGAWCSGPYEVEIEEGDGWLTVYQGNTCHDVRTGMLLSLTYEKRWLFTGEFDGRTYERQYFGDAEALNQTLTETSVELQYVDAQ